MEKTVLPRAWGSILNSKGFLPVIVKTIETFHDMSWSMEANSHDYFETVYVKKGSAVFEIAGKPVPIGPNDLIIIKPNQMHKLIVESPSGCEYIVLSLRFEDTKSGDISKISLDDFLNFVSQKETGAFISLKVSQKNEIIVLLKRILREREEADLGSDFLNHLLVMELFVFISRALKWNGKTALKTRVQSLKNSSAFRKIISTTIMNATYQSETLQNMCSSARVILRRRLKRKSVQVL